ncbi:heme ABC transporter substrate-binding protein IsdE [Romboutsia sp. 1001713B170207_170306_H8]|uniref:heme ABC transporter substrate-binding protein IsdE n=1 Tax=Romboutsia sp. 1001713B170207_170306_H8 TaxID=2787112 RepID=UPI001897A65A|nr:heme ABC transporter substrate-binding protein IsdE [Romboutsia sp. 1001713B170207_170306_H8]
MKLKKCLINIFALMSMMTIIGCSNDDAKESNVAKPEDKTYGEDSIVVATSVAVTEILDELGVKVSGVPKTSYELPQSIKDAIEVGAPMNPDLEIIKSLNPDLVVSVDTLGQDFIDTFTQNNIPSEFVNLSSYDGLKETINTLGKKFGKLEKASEIISQLESKESELEAKFNNSEKPNVLVIFGAPGTMMLGTSKSYVGNLVELAGGNNTLENSSSSFVQINKEELLNINPDKIVVMTHADPETTKAQVKETLESDAAWKNLEAVKDGNVYYLENDYFGMSANLKVIEALDMMHDILY